MLLNIYSWICEECLIPVNPREPQAASAPVAEPAPVVEAPAEEPAPVVESEPVVVESAPVVEETPAPVEEPKVEEPAPAPAEEPVEQPQPVETPKQVVVVQQVKGDSLVSKQNFHGHYDRFTIGLRGGASSLMHNSETGKWTCGGDVVLDLQYAHYWTDDSRPIDLGIITGIGLGYAQSSLKTAVNSDLRQNDRDGNPIHYTVRADEVKEHDGQLQLEIPLMFSLLHENGLFFNIGPKFMLPLYTPYNQTISNNENTYINAYFEEVGVDVTNEEFVGMLGDFSEKGSDYGNKFTINVMIGAEIGYEWILKSGNSLGLGAFANYSVYNGFSNKAAGTKSLIEVEGAAANEGADVTVQPATKTYAKGLGFFDVGVKVAYHFNFPKKRKTQDARLF